MFEIDTDISKQVEPPLLRISTQSVLHCHPEFGISYSTVVIST